MSLAKRVPKLQTAFGRLKVIRIDRGIAQSKAMLILDI
jgi:hypothetical protein